MKTAVITGITGQDGSYLSEYLLGLNYVVYGIVRRSSSFNTQRINHLMDDAIYSSGGVADWCKPFGKNLYLVFGDLLDASSIFRIIQEVKPDEVYNLGAQSHVRVSFDQPEITFNINALGTIKLLEAIRDSKKPVKFYQASSSEMWGNAPAPQNEETPFHPCSPYGISKLAAYWQVVNYRKHGMFACNGILCNHESPRRGEAFVTRKITRAAARIKLGLQKEIVLGNLDAKRDWGYAPEYVKAMWMMLQHDKPDDFICATGETHTVREFCELAFKHVDFDLSWEGSGVDEKGIDRKTGKTLVEINPVYFRPTEVDLLLGDASKIKKELGWEPKTRFEDLVRMMVEADLNAEKKSR